MANTKNIRTNLAVAGTLAVTGDVTLSGNVTSTGTLLPTYLSAVSSTSQVNSGSLNYVWLAMTTNSVALTPGIWELSGGYSAVSGSVDFVAIQWATVNGDDATSGATPLTFTLTGGNTVQAATVPPVAGVYQSYDAPDGAGSSAMADAAPTLRMSILANQTIYLLAAIENVSVTDADCQVSIYAKKL